MKTVAIILHHLSKLDYDTENDAKIVFDSQSKLYETLFNILYSTYNSRSNEEMESEESKEVRVLNLCLLVLFKTSLNSY